MYAYIDASEPNGWTMIDDDEALAAAHDLHTNAEAWPELPSLVCIACMYARTYMQCARTYAFACMHAHKHDLNEHNLHTNAESLPELPSLVCIACMCMCIHMNLYVCTYISTIYTQTLKLCLSCLHWCVLHVFVHIHCICMYVRTQVCFTQKRRSLA